MSHPTLLHQWFDTVWNNTRAETIAELMAPEAIVHGLDDENGNALRGPVGFAGFHKAFLEAFPDVQISIHEYIAKDGKEAVCCTVKGTHRGAFLGIAPTGKTVEFSGMCMVRVVDGKIAEAWNNFDMLSLHQQIGLASRAAQG